MQTILYVFGPFLFFAGLGIGAIYAAAQWVRHVVLPRGRLNEQRLQRTREIATQIEADARYYNHLSAMAAELILAIEANELLRDQLPADLLAHIYTLAEDRPRELPEGGRP